MPDLSVVGKPVTRVDANEKVTGEIVYGTRQGPLIHTNVCHGGDFFNFAGVQIAPEHMEIMRARGFTNGH